MEPRKIERLYILYDERGLDDPEEADVLVCCNTLEEALNYIGDFGEIAVVYSYAKENGKLVDEQFEQILMKEP